MEEKMKCPWCNELVVLTEGSYDGSYGAVVEKRCPKCRNLVLTRLKGIPETIIKKNAGTKA